jgi:hypothetical protein
MNGMKRKHMVMVNTKSGKAFRGIWWQCSLFQEYITLKNAELIESGSKPLPVDGELILFKRDVEFIQVLR